MSFEMTDTKVYEVLGKLDLAMLMLKSARTDVSKFNWGKTDNKKPLEFTRLCVLIADTVLKAGDAILDEVKLENVTNVGDPGSNDKKSKTDKDTLPQSLGQEGDNNNEGIDDPISS